MRAQATLLDPPPEGVLPAGAAADPPDELDSEPDDPEPDPADDPDPDPDPDPDSPPDDSDPLALFSFAGVDVRAPDDELRLSVL